MKVLALDIATRTGVCVMGVGGAPTAWSVDLGAGKSEEARFSAILVLTHTLIAKHKPDLVAIEATVGGKMASAYLIGLVACVRGCAANRGVRSQIYPINSIRRHFLGRAIAVRDFPGMTQAKAKKQIKAAVMERCRLLGWNVPDADAADAAALADFARATEGAQTTPAGGLFR
jgi:Holliday junction resolvasome RuvABC endonuclease subunit